MDKSEKLYYYSSLQTEDLVELINEEKQFTHDFNIYNMTQKSLRKAESELEKRH